MTLSDIFVYPIKSCGGIRLARHRVVATGLEHDRRWMLVDRSGKFISQRTVPALARVRVALQDGRLAVTAPGAAPLEIPFDVPHPRTMNAIVWDDSVRSLEYPQQFSSWFSDVLGTMCRLVSVADDDARTVRQDHAKPSDRVGFADAFPFLLISEASLEDLNRRFPRPVPMNRFRPNLVIKGTTAYAEDTWKRIHIGGMTFRIAKPCSRCSVPDVDQETGIPEIEVLSVLASYRTVGHKVLFGQNVIHDAMGMLEVGMTVDAIEQTP